VKHVLVVYSSQTGRTERMMRAACDGLRASGEAIELRVLPALEAGIDDLLWADGLLIATPENFGYMSGAVKDFLDRTYYPAQGKVDSLPYAVLVAAGNDGTGAVRAIERIAIGYKWKAMFAPVIMRPDVEDMALDRCRELGQTMAIGLSAGMF